MKFGIRKKLSRLEPCFCFFAVMVGSTVSAQQPRESRIGYIFPAGARLGTAVEITVGGQYLDGTQNTLISGSGIKFSIVRINHPLPQKRFDEFRDYLEETRKKLIAAKVPPAEMKQFGTPEKMASILKEAGASEDEARTFIEMRKQRNDPKRQQNMQLSESVTLKVEVAPDATTGVRELRLVTSLGATNPLSFCIGALPEVTGLGQTGATASTAAQVGLPSVINGWIPPGGADHYSFLAKGGAHLVIAVQARDLIPYLADAVPGWFQPIIVLHDSYGKEVAYADHFSFNPDPVLFCNVPQSGIYLLEIRDALYRGREDFVYRITVGEVPFVTGVFPLGGRTDFPTKIELSGWNLSGSTATMLPLREDGIHLLPAFGNGFAAGCTVFGNDSLPQITEPLHEHATNVKLPIVINGRLDAPGDVAHYSFTCEAGDKVIAETTARRLNSPLDSWLKVTDPSGQQVAFNDDFEDKGAALQTHSADSHLVFTALKRGIYTLHLGDSEGKGGPEYAYRLRISSPRPDFAVRIVPSCINARSGATIPVTLYALRKDGFNGPVTVALKEAPAGFLLDGGLIPAGQDKVRATLTMPSVPPEKWVANIAPIPTPTPSPVATMVLSATTMMTGSATPTPRPVLISVPAKLIVEGRGTIEGKEVIRPAVPVDDRTQAFLIHHLVPSREWLVVTTGSSRAAAPLTVTSSLPVKIPTDGTLEVTLASAGFTLGRTQLQLSDPPEGISIESFTTSAIILKADKAKPGLKGNLIVETFNEWSTAPKDGKPAEKRRNSTGFLPAIPFEIESRGSEL